jgi:hypothetical protein
MSLDPNCDACGDELDTFGGILLGPPNARGWARKEHLCVSCYERVRALIRPARTFKRRASHGP